MLQCYASIQLKSVAYKSARNVAPRQGSQMRLALATKTSESFGQEPVSPPIAVPHCSRFVFTHRDGTRSAQQGKYQTTGLVFVLACSRLSDGGKEENNLGRRGDWGEKPADFLPNPPPQSRPFQFSSQLYFSSFPLSESMAASNEPLECFVLVFVVDVLNQPFRLIWRHERLPRLLLNPVTSHWHHRIQHGGFEWTARVLP